MVRWFRGCVWQQVLWADCEVSKIKTTVSFWQKASVETLLLTTGTKTEQNKTNPIKTELHETGTSLRSSVMPSIKFEAGRSERLETRGRVCVWFSSEDSAAVNIKVSLFSSSPPPSPAPSLCGGGCFFRSRPAHLFYRKKGEGLWRWVSVFDDCTLSLSAVSVGEGKTFVSLK